jgi:two-component system sensor histidine kinase KdpD
MEDVIEAVIERMRSALAGRTIRTMIRRDLPAVWIDPIQIDQVLTNIVENAVRWSPPGGEIAVSAARWQDAVRVRVADQGPGVPKEDRDRVFEAFATGRGDTRPGGGTGLGLAIARAIVGAHGGRIWIEGVPGGGTAVVFDLPVSHSDEPATVEAAGS